MKKTFTTCLLALCALYNILAQGLPQYNISSTTVTDTAGILFDDGGEFGNYSDGVNHIFKIQPSNGKPVNIRFESFVLETNELGLSNLCIYDYLLIHDGPDTTAFNLERYCGNSAPPSFTSSGGAVTIQLVSDGATNFPGFKMFWSTGDLPPSNTSYCEASGPFCGEELYHISSFTFNNFTNQSGTCDDPNNNGSNYSDFTDLIIDYEVGELVTIFGLYSGAIGTEVTTIYIDWNQDGDFEDASESYPTVSTGPATLEFFTTIVPPQEYTQGYTRLRVRTYDVLVELGTIGACGVSADGEVEDYTLLVLDPANPLPTCPNTIFPKPDSANTCLDIDFVWNTVTGATGYTYKLFEKTNGNLVTQVNQTDTSFSVKSLQANTTYQWLVQALNDNGVSIDCDTLEFTTGKAHPVASFSQDTIALCNNEAFSFSVDTSEGVAPFKYFWDGTAKAILDDTSATNPNFIPAGAGFYELTVFLEDARGCIGAKDSAVIQLNDAPVPQQLSAFKSSWCFTDSILIQAQLDNNTVFQQSNDNSQFVDFVPQQDAQGNFPLNLPAGDTIYIRAITSSEFCSDTSQTLLQSRLVALDKGLIDTISGSLKACIGDTLVFQALNYDSNLVWNTGDATDSIWVFTSTELFYTYTDSFSCSVNSDTLSIRISELPNPISTSYNNLDSLEFCSGDTLLLTVNYNDPIWSDINSTQNDSLFVTVPGSYYPTVVFEDCEFLGDTIEVIERPLPEEIEISFDTNTRLCQGIDSLYLVANQDLFWLDMIQASDSLLVVSSETIFGKAINQFGCQRFSDTLEVEFSLIPSAPVIVRDSLKLLFVENPEEGFYTWFRDGEEVLQGSNEDTLFLSLAGEYTVQFTSLAGCSSEISEPYLYDPTSVNEYIFRNLQVFPNPVSTHLFIEGMPQGKKELQIADASGRVLWIMDSDEEKMKIPTNFKAGLYLLTIRINGVSTAKKLIVE
ncbi:MAG: GEVED domain-containing protein [Luteibaculum sp.]